MEDFRGSDQKGGEREVDEREKQLNDRVKIAHSLLFVRPSSVSFPFLSPSSHLLLLLHLLISLVMKLI